VSLSITIREQLIRSFGDELAEHVQTMTDGLLALEQQQVTGEERRFTMENVFRAAHSLKGDARALGISAIEQLAHALENLLDAMQRDVIELTPELFTVCYRALDTIQLVQAVYESGGTTPPIQVLQTLAEIEAFQQQSMGEKPKAAAEKIKPKPQEKATVQDISPPEEIPDDGAIASELDMLRPYDLVPGELPQDDGQWEMPTSPPALPAEGTGENEKRISHGVEIGKTSPLRKGSDHESPGDRGKKSQMAPQRPKASGTLEVPEMARKPQRPTLPPSVGSETIRVSVDKLDALMAQLSELLVTKIRSEQRLAQVRQAQEFVSQWQKEWLFVRKTHGRLVRKLDSAGDIEQVGQDANELKKDMQNLLDYLNVNQENLRQMYTVMNTLSREYANDAMQASLVIDALEEEVKQIRMLPLSTITGPFGRMVRDLAQAADKEAMLQIIGGDVELDKRVLEKIKDPLIHLLRNAIDHGIEPPEQRVNAGKSRIGTITLEAEQLGKDVVIRVSDDGRGLDTDAIRRVAAQRAGMSNAWELDEAELVELIFNSRFSTSPIITDVSGRGVGLDVVRSNVEMLGGRVSVDWSVGRGAVFAMTLPLTMTSSRGLLVRVSNELFAIPFSAIERIVRIKPSKILSLGGHDALRHQGQPLPLVHLSDTLGLSRVATSRLERNNAPILVVILAAAERYMAFVVDELAGEQEMVVKGLGPPLTRVGGIAGATVMGDGQVLLVLNVADLIKLATRGKRLSVLAREGVTGALATSELDVPMNQRHILVVDDSVTTRTLEKNILEAAGYKVELATDGQEALGMIVTSGLPDLIISDIVMPRLDGFGLTRRIKEDERTSHIPIILVSSLDSPEDKTRGIDAGADAYIIKNRFDQNNLLDTIGQLI
jgi:two-component system chemotaxis sensor kinase CheA